MKIRKAVIPAAGFGTRFLPATKAQPKEMLPVVDKPIIQYVVEDAVEAGIEDIVIVTGWHKRTIEDHFDYPFELEQRLKESNKMDQLEEIQRISNMANFIYIRQKGPIGNATPILNAKEVIGEEPFLVLWGDDVIQARPCRGRQLIEAYERFKSPVLGSIRTKSEEDSKRYGFAAGEMIEDGVIKVSRLVEKPGPEKVPSDLAVVGGMVLTPEIFEAIESLEIKPNEELVYIDALNVLMKKQPVYAVEIKNGKYHDCGSKLGYLKANVELGLEREEFNSEFLNYLKGISGRFD
ncbi:MAG: UTP--glucose-1-phosphate uridylyltransferase [Patescibacteria group bacterium]|nr:UTP--glucose-1-phosphate uridylyltransferase [Patescibacteria group bacterium]